MMEALRQVWLQVAEFVRLICYGQTSASVAACEHAVTRAKEDLALALHARDQALAAIRIHDAPPSIPSFLLTPKEPA